MQCGFCSLLSELFSRAMCFKNRRSSTESYYKELGDQDTLKIEDKASDSEESAENNRPLAQSLPELAAMAYAPRTGRFLTMHKRRKKKLLTRSLCQDVALLDDDNSSVIQCILDQSALWKFNAFALDNVSGGRSLPVLCVHLFKLYGLIKHFGLQPVRLWKLFTLIEEGYHSSNPYHNHVHATDVTQAMHCFLQQDQIRENLEPLEVMASLIASIAHDVDHPGVNQPFLIATSNHLASLYKNTSVLENHHWRWAMSCLAESGLVSHMPDARRQLEAQISSLILATDITRQQEFLSSFKEHLDKQTLNLRRQSDRHLVLQIALKCADISNPCRPWDVSRKWSLKVCDEFFRQGDYERRLNLPVTELCDRQVMSIPKIQAGFFQYVVTPLMTQWNRFLQNGLSAQMLRNLQYNKSMWQQLLEQEKAQETHTEISEADAIEEDVESTTSNVSSSSELLIPPRRCSLAVTRQREHDRRLSVPLNVRDTRHKDRFGRSSLTGSKTYKLGSSLVDSERSLHSQLSLADCEQDEHVLSTENLLPDSSIASITTPKQATLLNTVLGNSSKLQRQQTFPPVEARAALRGYSQDGGSPPNKTEIGQNYLEKCGMSIFSNFFRKSEDKTDNDEASDVGECTYNTGREKENQEPGGRGRRRESAPVGLQLKDNITAFQVQTFTKEQQLMLRRKSMPTDVVPFAPKEKKAREGWLLPQLLGRTVSERRRGSAPVTNEIHVIVGGAVRHSLNGAAGRHKKKDLQLTPAWIVKTTYQLQEKHRAVFQRRSSLPIEVLKGGTFH